MGQFTARVISEEIISSEADKTQSAELSIEGMTCASCVNMIESVLGCEEGVQSVSVNLLTNSGVVQFSDPATVDSIISAIEDVTTLKY